MEPPGASDSDSISALCTQISSSFASAGAPASGPPPTSTGKLCPSPEADALKCCSCIPPAPFRPTAETLGILESHKLGWNSGSSKCYEITTETWIIQYHPKIMESITVEPWNHLRAMDHVRAMNHRRIMESTTLEPCTILEPQGHLRDMSSS